MWLGLVGGCLVDGGLLGGVPLFEGRLVDGEVPLFEGRFLCSRGGWLVGRFPLLESALNCINKGNGYTYSTSVTICGYTATNIQ